MSLFGSSGNCPGDTRVGGDASLPAILRMLESLPSAKTHLEGPHGVPGLCSVTKIYSGRSGSCTFSRMSSSSPSLVSPSSFPSSPLSPCGPLLSAYGEVTQAPLGVLTECEFPTNLSWLSLVSPGDPLPTTSSPDLCLPVALLDVLCARHGCPHPGRVPVSFPAGPCPPPSQRPLPDPPCLLSMGPDPTSVSSYWPRR